MVLRGPATISRFSIVSMMHQVDENLLSASHPKDRILSGESLLVQQN